MRARICSTISCDMFARVVWLRLRRVRDYRLSLCYLPHALATHYFLRLTRARRGGSEGGRRKSSLLTFGTFGHTKVREKKSYFKYLRGRTMLDPCLGDADRVCFANRSIPALRDKIKVQPTAKTKDICLSAFSFAYTGAKEKAIKKKTPK